MRNPITRRLAPLPLALASAVVLGACGDDATDIGEHLEVDGFALFQGTDQIYRYTLDDGAPSGLALEVGTHDVVFIPLDAGGQAIPEEDDHDHEEIVLQIQVADTGVLTWTPGAAGGVHEFVEFRGELAALQAGSTTMNVCVPHEGHCDFEVDVPVTVSSP